MPLNESQSRVVTVALAHVSELLEQVDHVARTGTSPFARERLDLSPHELRLLAAYVTQARRRMLDALEHLGVAHPAPSVSARWSILTALMLADVALQDLTPSRLRGYGSLDPGLTPAVEAVAADLRAVVARGQELLRDTGSERLARLLDGVAGPEGEILRELERLTTRHHLAELRPLLQAAAERLVARTFDVGLFGRVSAGKSSLVNALVGSPVLPVGAVPVTTVALRIVRGDEGARVAFEDGHTEEVPLRGLGDFVTEASNPGNRRGVRDIEARSPAVPERFAYIDTPGTGGLAGLGGASSFAWLPRCDHALVLVPAAAALETEDLALLQALSDAGIPYHVLLSKADLLSPADLEQSIAYIRAGVSTGDAAELPVVPVSVLAGAAAGLDHVREALARSRDAGAPGRSGRIRARLQHLVDAVASAPAGQPADSGTGRTRLEAEIGRLRARLTQLDGGRATAGLDGVRGS